MSKLRDSNCKKLQSQDFDVLIVGGGINGAVAASALAAKGARVALIDKGDFAGSTSSNSSNLAWGGIKYLESQEYGLVYKLCKSRNQLMRHYPSTVKEIRFLTSIQKGFRYPPFFVFLGTILYWLIGKCRTLAPEYLSTDKIKASEAVINKKNLAGGFEYSDCYLHDNDARFVFNFIRQGMSYGCIAANYVELDSATRINGLWHAEVMDNIDGQRFMIKSRVFINAAGPHVDKVNQILSLKTKHHHLYSKGIHLIVDRITDSGKVLTFFADDGRLFFVIPMGRRTCIGTTDEKVTSPNVKISRADVQFVLENANRLLDLKKPLTKDSIIATRCGVRPLVVEDESSTDDWLQLSRKHAIDLDRENQHLSIFGGKLTDCINIGEEVADLVKSLGVSLQFSDYQWFGEPDESVKKEFMHQAQLMGLDDLTPSISSEPLTQRFWRRYGENALKLLESIREDPEKSKLLIANAEYLRVEVEHAARCEMIVKLEDFLRRRSKISLVLRKQEILSAPGLLEACEILFGAQANEKLQEYKEQVEDNEFMV